MSCISQSLSLERLGMNWIIISFAVFVSAFQAHITSGRPQTTQNAIDELSLVTRYDGMGYSTQQANPEGDFYRSGINPGIKTTRFIFNHTYWGNLSARSGGISHDPELCCESGQTSLDCTKTSSGTSSFIRPRGKYCIARYGSSCPSGFYGGYIHWDDEDNNINGKQYPIPDGNYDRNTGINYCCRSDGNITEPMLLPPNKAFALYRYDGACQKVLGMRDPVQLFVHFDDEDSRNANSCSGNHPDGPSNRNQLHCGFKLKNSFL